MTIFISKALTIRTQGHPLWDRLRSREHRGSLGPDPLYTQAFLAALPILTTGQELLSFGGGCDGRGTHRAVPHPGSARLAGLGSGRDGPESGLPGRRASGSGRPRAGSCGAAPPGRDETLEPPAFSPPPGPPLPPFALASFLSALSRSCPRLTRRSAASGRTVPSRRSATWLVTSSGSLS